jgi:predicted DNA-binding protein (MmcQ/YjbR family)
VTTVRTDGVDWLAYCLAKPGAWRDEPWDGQVVVKVAERIFAFLGPAPPVVSLGVKCGDREVADLWLERHPGAGRWMPHLGAGGWNSYVLDGLTEDDVAELIDRSYELVLAKLPRSRRPTGS